MDTEDRKHPQWETQPQTRCPARPAAGRPGSPRKSPISFRVIIRRTAGPTLNRQWASGTAASNRPGQAREAAARDRLQGQAAKSETVKAAKHQTVQRHRQRKTGCGQTETPVQHGQLWNEAGQQRPPETRRYNREPENRSPAGSAVRRETDRTDSGRNRTDRYGQRQSGDRPVWQPSGNQRPTVRKPSSNGQTVRVTAGSSRPAESQQREQPR